MAWFSKSTPLTKKIKSNYNHIFNLLVKFTQNKIILQNFLTVIEESRSS